jgi:hypothetical protein
MRLRHGVAIAGVMLSPSAAFAATLSVGPGKTYAKPCAAIAAAQPGDVIEVEATGNYAGDTCAWATDNLTVRGVNGRAKIDATNVAVAQMKGIFVISAPNATVENFELMGAAISMADGNNGAGIRHQGLNLTVRNCFFHDNQDGILGGPPTDGQGTVLIEHSEFSHNGAGDGFSHNMYLNHYASFTLQYSYSHHGNVGHLVKTRALVNFILYSRITDETGGAASYEIDVPNAGTTYIIGNVIEQAATTQNPSIVAYGEEGVVNPDAHLFVVNNTIWNDKGSGTFVNVGGAVTVPAVLTNNVFSGGGTITSQATATKTTNFDDSMGNPMLANPATFDAHLLAGSPCIDKGTPPGSNGAQALAPDHEYVQPENDVPRSIVGSTIDIGAYELGNPADAGSSGGDGGSAGDSGSIGDGSVSGGDGGGTNGDGGANADDSGSSGGCGCTTARTETNLFASSGATLLALAALLRRRASVRASGRRRSSRA